MLTQIATEQANLKWHRYLMNLEESPLCDCGEDKESASHVLIECPLQARNRWQYLGKATLKQEDIPKLRIEKVLKFAKATKKW